MATVWITKAAGHEFEEARVYGELKVLVSEDISPFNLDLARRTISEALSSAGPDDYLLVSGPAVLNMVAVDELAKRFGSFRLLLYHARTRKYLPRDMRLESHCSLTTR